MISDNTSVAFTTALNLLIQIFGKVQGGLVVVIDG